MIRRILLFAVLVLGAVGVANVPAGAQYVPPCSLLVEPVIVAPGGTVTVSGSGAPPGATVEARLNGVLLGTTVASADADGVFFFASLQIPASLTPGDYTLEFSIAGGEPFQESCDSTSVLTTIITVQVPPRPGGGGGATGLPPTGSDSLPMLQLGAALLAIGGLLTLAARKRRDEAGAATRPAEDLVSA